MLSNLLLILFALTAPPRLHGIAVTPYSEAPERGLTFDGMIDEIAETGASHVSIVVQWSQASVTSNLIAPHPKQTQDETVIRRMIRRARAAGLKVVVFPIIWVEQRGPGMWRGTLRPENPGLWWTSHRTFILHAAQLARDEGAAVFSVGSELGSMEAQEGRWRGLIAEVRSQFRGQILYSANWDHFEHVSFWDAVDLVGLTAYHRLTTRPPPARPDLDELRAAWARIRLVVVDFSQRIGRPVVFTEVGYPSQASAAHRPWDYAAGSAPDLALQADCYRAFVETWRDEAALSGVFFWNWWGVGGAFDADYTPRGKPALEHLRGLFRQKP
ncbi:MAG: hypothetical protein EXR76_00300 [Myxococcales bacterium]|nr:hypothetical protein [Myxococcales bacterium]